MKQLRRTMLYIPGSKPGMIRDAGIYKADCIMLDLEDSVSLSEKDSARFLVHQALRRLELADKEYLVRVNTLESPMGVEDLEAVVPTGRVVVRLPKAESADDIHRCEEQIARIERASGVAVGSTKMMAAVESAAGVLNAREIACASRRLVAIAIGAEDYAADLKTTRSPEGTELMFGRSMVLQAARVAGIDAIDTVFSDVEDEAGLRAETRLIKQLGFDGKSVINPRQIAPVHEVFTPTADEVSQAMDIIDAIERANRNGSGVISLGGKMIDRPIVLRAQRLVEFAIASGVTIREAQHG